MENELTEQSLNDYASQIGFQTSFKISAKTGEGVDKALNYLIHKVINAEHDGLYMMPIFQRDHNIHKLSVNDDGRKKDGSVFKNLCC